MSTIITTSTTSTTGFELIVKDENGKVTTTMPIDDIVDNGKTLVLPENPSNRKYFNIEKVKKAGGTVELTYKPTKTLTTGPRKSLEDYMTEEEKATIAKIEADAKARRDAEREANKKPAKKSNKTLAAEYQVLVEALKAAGMTEEQIAKMIEGEEA